MSLKNRRPCFSIPLFLATAGFTGHIPLLAGTLASLEGVLLSLIVNSNPWLKAMVLIVALISGTYLAGRVEKISGIKDNHSIVIDEVIGAIVATFFLPPRIWLWIFAFIAFRAFDWLKPFPIRRIEKLRGGIGIVADDVLAGLYSLGLIWGIIYCKKFCY